MKTKKIANEKKDKDKSYQINSRLDKTTALKFESLMQARGLNKTDTIKFCINNTAVLQIGNVEELSTEFCKIRMALENNKVNENIRKEVNLLCRSMCDLLAEVEKLKR